MRISLRLPTAVLLLTLAGCDEEPLACDTMAAASALIHVVGEDGTTPIVGTLTATDESGNPVEVMCAGADTEACTDWIVGWEVEGRITVEASSFDGCNTGTGVVEVDVPLDESGCHVVQQEATLVVNEWTDLGCK